MAGFAAALAGLGVVLFASTLLWLRSVRRQDASIADIWWGPGFVLLAWLYWAIPGAFAPRPLVIALLLTVWGLRLGAHIHRRHRGQAEDPRYRAMRASRGSSFWWRSLFVVFWLQAAILWFVALPVWAAARTATPDRVTPTDALGLLLFVAGFAFEVVGDTQLARFRANPANRGRVLDTGLWRYTRHPNYFGDAVLWWGVYLMAASVPGGWLTVLSPLLMTLLLLRVSGVALLEQSLRTTKPGYADYIARTSSFIPWFQRDAGSKRTRPTMR
jgi:steroid 5-alpha reductase family enzyme